MAMKVSEIYDRLEGRTNGQMPMPVAIGDEIQVTTLPYPFKLIGLPGMRSVGGLYGDESKVSLEITDVPDIHRLTKSEVRKLSFLGDDTRVSDGLTIEQIYAPAVDVEPIKIRQYFVCYGRAYTLVRDSGNKVILSTVGGEWHGWAGWSEVVDALNITRAEWEDIIGHSTKPVIRVSWQELTTFYKKCLGL